MREQIARNPMTFVFIALGVLTVGVLIALSLQVIGVLNPSDMPVVANLPTFSSTLVATRSPIARASAPAGTLTGLAFSTPNNQDAALFTLTANELNPQVAAGSANTVVFNVRLADLSLRGKVVRFEVSGSGTVSPTSTTLSAVTQVIYAPASTKGLMQITARVELPDRVASATAAVTVYQTAPVLHIGNDDFIAFFAPGVDADIPITIADQSANGQLLPTVDYRVSMHISSTGTSDTEQVMTVRGGSGSLHIPYISGQSQIQLSVQLKDLPSVAAQTYTVGWGTPADALQVLGDLTACEHGRLLTIGTRAKGMLLANPLVISYESLLATSGGLQLQSNENPWPPLQKQQVVTTQYGFYSIVLKPTDNTAGGLIRIDVHGAADIRSTALAFICNGVLLWRTNSPLRVGDSQAALRIKASSTGRLLSAYILAPFQAGSETPVLLDFWIPDTFTAVTDNQLLTNATTASQAPIMFSNQSLGTLDITGTIKNIWIEDKTPDGERAAYTFTVKGMPAATVWRHVYALAIAPVGALMLPPTPIPPTPTRVATQSVTSLPVRTDVPPAPPAATAQPPATGKK